MAEAAIFTGYWMNWSKDNRLLGATITLPSRQGDFLVAFLALFVSWAGGQLWTIICFTIHQLKSTIDQRDGLHHQHQAVLRNSVTSTTTFRKLFTLANSWKMHTRKPLWRSLPLLLLALAHVLLFGVAGVFSSRVIRSGDDVLVQHDLCGFYPNTDLSKPLENYTESDWDMSNIFIRAGQVREQTKNQYTRACYADQSSPQSSPCNFLVRKRIDSQVNESAICPFKTEMCVNETALQFDTGFISSDSDLGINGRENDRVWFRAVTTWTPINAANYTSPWLNLRLSNISEQRWRLYYFGNARPGGVPGNPNYTFFLTNVSSPSPLAYELHQASWFGSSNDSDFTPIAALNRLDADVTLIALNNYAVYTQPVHDVWFNAPNVIVGGFGGNDVTYQASQNLTFLGMMCQYQFCSSSDFRKSCTPLRGKFEVLPDYYNSSYNGFSNFTLRQRATAGLIWSSASYNSIRNSIIAQGSVTLSASSHLWGAIHPPLSAGLPIDQWKIEAFNFHNASLAGLQRVLVERVAPHVFDIRPNVSSVHFLDNVTRPEDLTTCKAQKVRNTAYSSFSVLGISIILVLGALIIILSFCITDVVFWIRSRQGTPSFKELEWITGDALQMQRLLMEAKGIGIWEGKRRSVPVIKDFDKRFGFNMQSIGGVELTEASHSIPDTSLQIRGYSSVPGGMI